MRAALLFISVLVLHAVVPTLCAAGFVDHDCASGTAHNDQKSRSDHQNRAKHESGCPDDPCQVTAVATHPADHGAQPAPLLVAAIPSYNVLLQLATASPVRAANAPPDSSYRDHSYRKDDLPLLL